MTAQRFLWINPKPDKMDMYMNATCWEAASSPWDSRYVHTSVNIDGEGGCELTYTKLHATQMRDNCFTS